MTELIDAAKAVIERWDTPLWKDVPATATYIARLRDAVERAEKQEAVGFEEWWNANAFAFLEIKDEYAHEIWTAAQQAERERIKDIIAAIGVSGKNECWDCCETILEKIDATE